MSRSEEVGLRNGCRLLGLLGMVAAIAAGTGTDVLSAQDVHSLHVQVNDERTGEPLGSVQVRVPERGMVVFSNSEGQAVVRGLPAGTYRIEFQILGYGSGEREVSLPRSEPLEVELRMEAIALEEIAVEVEDVLRMERRRRAISMPVTVLDSTFLAQELRPLAEVLTSADLILDRCPGPARFGQACVRFWGRWVVPQICVDERRIPNNDFWEINSYIPQDLHTVEVFKGGARGRVVVYILSNRFMARALERGNPLSQFLPCVDVTRTGR
jgi:hypothetical protein